MLFNKNKSNWIDTTTLDLLPIALVIYDNKTIYFLNKKAIQLLQLSKQHLQQTNSIFQFLDKQNHKKLKQYNTKITNGQKLPAIELILNTAKNKSIFVEAKCNSILFETKKCIQATFTELNILKQNQLELQTGNTLLQKIIKNNFEVLFEFSFQEPQGLKFISESSNAILGYSAATVLKNHAILLTRIYDEDKHYLIFNKADYLRVFENNKTKKVIVRYYHPTKKLTFLETEVNPIYNTKKVLIGLIGSIRDISSKIDTEQRLVETKNKFDLITQNSNDIIAFYTYFPNEKYMYISPNVFKLLGYKPNEFINDSNFFNKRIVENKSDFIKAKEVIYNYQKNNTQKNYHFTFKTIKKSKQEVWLENNVTPICNSKNEIVFFLNIIRDITTQKEKELELQQQHLNYRNLLDNSPAAYIIHNKGVAVFCNQAMLKLLQLKSEKQILGKFALDYFVEKDRMKAINRIKSVYNRIDLEKSSNYTIKDSKGNLIETEMKSSIINFNKIKCILTLVNNITEKQKIEKEKIKSEMIKINNEFLLLEIKERQEAEKKLLEKTAHLTSIFESSDHLIWTINNRFELTSFNKNFLDVVEKKYKAKLKIGQKITDILEPAEKKIYTKFWYPIYRQALAGKKIEFEKENFIDKKVYHKVYINPIFKENNAVTEINCIAHDVTDSIVYEQKLLEQTGKLQAIFDSSHHYIWTIDTEYKLTSFNKNYFELVAILYNTKPFLGFKANRGLLADNQEYAAVLEYHYNKAFMGVATNFEIETVDKNQKKIYLDIFLNPIIENGKTIEVSGIAHNVTEKKIDQQRVQQSLKEKDVLLKEVHHRVKNNMQIISSILNLQSSYVTDNYTLALLKESQNRIKTMAYIHESLYQNKSFTSVNFSEYIQTLVKNIIQSYVLSSEKIELSLNLQKIELNLDLSIPAGLIVNELITNAIKHAFTNLQKGKISLILKSKNNTVFLQVMDNGIGIPPSIDYNTTNTLGLQLVNTLIDQLDGEIKFTSKKEKGTKVLITFKM